MVVAWFAASQGSRAALPFYCDAERVGAFAVAPEALAAGDDDALFRLFVCLCMYQALRDVVIMRQQYELPVTRVQVVADVACVGDSVARHPCDALRSVESFEAGCDVFKTAGVIDCVRMPGHPCHVKDATSAFRRMGDMGKLPTSAWLRLWKDGGVHAVLDDVCREEAAPARRAELLVARFSRVTRVGRKLATMFVSQLSTPPLAPGLTPWFPAVDGNELVVVDTNVARAVDALREAGAPKTYDARERWIRDRAARLDLSTFHAEWPSYSPRLVQQALYAYGSKSNRVASRDACANRTSPCEGCVNLICPFGSRRP